MPYMAIGTTPLPSDHHFGARIYLHAMLSSAGPAKAVLPRSGPGGPLLVAKKGPPGLKWAAKSGPPSRPIVVSLFQVHVIRMLLQPILV